MSGTSKVVACRGLGGPVERKRQNITISKFILPAEPANHHCHEHKTLLINASKALGPGSDVEQAQTGRPPFAAQNETWQHSPEISHDREVLAEVPRPAAQVAALLNTTSSAGTCASTIGAGASRPWPGELARRQLGSSPAS